MAPIRYSGRLGEERGAALVEFALTLPLLLVVIAGIVDFGFAFQRYEVLTNAAREGARMASLPNSYTDDMIKARVRQYVQVGLGIPNGTALDAVLPLGNIQILDNDPPIQVDTGSGPVTLDSKTVLVHYHHNWLLLRPILGLISKSWGNSITLKASSQMRLEASTASGS